MTDDLKRQLLEAHRSGDKAKAQAIAEQIKTASQQPAAAPAAGGAPQFNAPASFPGVDPNKRLPLTEENKTTLKQQLLQAHRSGDKATADAIARSLKGEAPASPQAPAEDTSNEMGINTGPREDTSFGGAIEHGYASRFKNFADATKWTGGNADLESMFRSQAEGPEGYKPAEANPLGIGMDAIRALVLKQPEAVGRLLDANYGEVPRAVAESLPAMAMDIGGSLLGTGVGAAASANPFVAAGAGAAAPFLMEGYATLGRVLEQRAQEKGITNPDDLTDEDWQMAFGAAGLSGAMNAFGIKGTGKEAGKMLQRLVSQISREGVTGAGQEATEQFASTAGTPGGTEMNWENVANAGIMSAAARSPFASSGEAMRPGINTLSTTPQARNAIASDPETAALFSDRLAQEAKSSGLNLKKIGNKEPKGAYKALDNINKQLSTEIDDLVRTLKEPLSGENVDPQDRLAAKQAVDLAKTKIATTVGGDHIAAVESLVGDTQEGQRLLNAIKQKNILAEMHEGGVKGGILSMFDKGRDSPLTVGKALKYLVPGGALSGGAYLAGGPAGLAALPLAGMAASGAAFLSDRATGRRYVAQNFKDAAKNPEASRSAMERVMSLPSVEEGKRSAKQSDLLAKAEAAKQGEAERVRSAELRRQRREQDDPGIAGFDRSIYDQMGLKPKEVDKGLNMLLDAKAISQEEFDRFHNDPARLKRNNVGNRILDQLEKLRQDGKLTRSPDWQAPQAEGGQANIRNPIAYKAAAEGKQARYTEAFKSLLSQGMTPEQANATLKAMGMDVPQ